MDVLRIRTGACGVIAKKQFTHTEPASTACENTIALSRFLVRMPAANPYVVSLARAIASSKVLNFSIDCTGPKIYRSNGIMVNFILTYKAISLN